MSLTIDDLDEINNVSGPVSLPLDPLARLQPVESAQTGIREVTLPRNDGYLSPNKLSPLPESAKAVERAAVDARIKSEKAPLTREVAETVFNESREKVAKAILEADLERQEKAEINPDALASLFPEQGDLAASLDPTKEELDLTTADPKGAFVKAKEFPDPARAILNFALAYEKMGGKQLAALEKKTHDCLDNIDLLLKLNGKLAKMPEEKDGHVLSDEVKQMFAELKEKGISIWEPNEEKMSKEKLLEIKSLISSNIDKNRSESQIIFTKVQTVTHYLTSAMDTVKMALRKDVKDTAVRNQKQ